jgi:hypothetical protein
MRREYIIGTAAVLLAAAVAASPCPPALTAVAHEVASLRHISGPFLPPCREISQTGLRDALAEKMRRDLPVEPQLYLEALRRLGFADEAPAEAYPRLLDFYTAQVLGYYEPRTDEMILVQRPSANEQEERMVWAHELEHAVQEHRFHLPSRLLAMRSDSDEQRAASAVAEGEAMLVMVLLNGTPAGGSALEQAESAVARQASALPSQPGLPAFFVADLVFPYTTGFRFVVEAYRHGGWAAVDGLLAHPPRTTAALLQPGLAPPPAPLTDGVPPVPAGYRDVITDTVGEWALAFWLGRGMPANDAQSAAAGWDGDRFRLVRSASDPSRWALAWHLRCRTEAGRVALERALRSQASARLAHLAGGHLTPKLVWVAHGRELDVRADWP